MEEVTAKAKRFGILRVLLLITVFAAFFASVYIPVYFLRQGEWRAQRYDDLRAEFVYVLGRALATTRSDAKMDVTSLVPEMRPLTEHQHYSKFHIEGHWEAEELNKWFSERPDFISAYWRTDGATSEVCNLDCRFASSDGGEVRITAEYPLSITGASVNVLAYLWPFLIHAILVLTLGFVLISSRQ